MLAKNQRGTLKGQKSTLEINAKKATLRINAKTNARSLDKQHI